MIYLSNTKSQMSRTLLLFLLISLPCFAQFKVKYSDFQNKYAENSTVTIDSVYEKCTIVEKSVNINFIFNKPERKLSSIIFQKDIGISSKEIDDFEDIYLDNFKPTRIKKAEGISVYYDELQELMKFKVFLNADSNVVTVVAYTIEKHDINPFIVLMDKDGVKSKLRRKK
jgi:hypothetical protein